MTEAIEDAMADQAEPESRTVAWRGLTFQVPPPSRWVFGYQLGVRRQDISVMLEAILGPEQTDELFASGNTDAETDLPELVALLTDAAGEA